MSSHHHHRQHYHHHHHHNFIDKCQSESKNTSTIVFEVRTAVSHVETVVVTVARGVVRVHYDRVEVGFRHLDEDGDDDDGGVDDDGGGGGDDEEFTPHSGSLPSQHFFASLQLPISPTTFMIM